VTQVAIPDDETLAPCIMSSGCNRAALAQQLFMKVGCRNRRVRAELTGTGWEA
jgi:hypothetical protein